MIFDFTIASGQARRKPSRTSQTGKPGRFFLKRFLLTATLTLLLPARIQSQDEWSQLNSCILNRPASRQEARIVSIVFLDANRGVLGGSSGLVRYTVNGGLTWKASRFETSATFTDDVLKIVALDDDRLFLVSYKYFLQSVDGGKNWRSMDLPFPIRYRSLFPASGTASPTTVFYDVSYDNQDSVWVLGAAYDNTGKNPYGNFLIRFGLRNNVREGVLYPVPSTRKEVMLQVFFADDRNGWIVGGGGTILHSNDSGNSWMPQAFPAFNARPAQNESQAGAQLNSIFFRGRRRGWIAGDAGTILLSDDGGDSWVPGMIMDGDRNTDLYQVYFVNDQLGWAVGAKGSVFKSGNGGRSWTRQPVATSQDLFSLQFDERSGWVVGAADTLLRYEIVSDRGQGLANEEKRRRRSNR